jgi:hypothetical protein
MLDAAEVRFSRQQVGRLTEYSRLLEGTHHVGQLALAGFVQAEAHIR